MTIAQDMKAAFANSPNFGALSDRHWVFLYAIARRLANGNVLAEIDAWAIAFATSFPPPGFPEHDAMHAAFTSLRTVLAVPAARAELPTLMTWITQQSL